MAAQVLFMHNHINSDACRSTCLLLLFCSVSIHRLSPMLCLGNVSQLDQVYTCCQLCSILISQLYNSVCHKTVGSSRPHWPPIATAKYNPVMLFAFVNAPFVLLWKHINSCLFHRQIQIKTHKSTWSSLKLYCLVLDFKEENSLELTPFLSPE